MTEELSRTSALASRHIALGSGLEDWNGMGTAWSYSSNPNDEHDAVRERAGMFDMSPLKKVHVRGRDAAAVLDHATTRDMKKIKPGRAAYLSVLTDQGTMADDAIVYNLAEDDWLIVHGSGDTAACLDTSAQGKNCTISLDDELHDISVQGPEALTILNGNCSADLSTLDYFHHTEADLFGHRCRISRTGYSGERGYEVFCKAETAGEIWDGLAASAVMPCSFTALDKLRIEAGLLFYGYDMTADHTPWEVGLGFTINRHKSGYRGHEAVMTAKGNERILNVCLTIDHDDMVNGGEVLSRDGVDVGVVNSPCYSHRMGKSLALAHVLPAAALRGTRLRLTGDGIDTTASVANLPIYDPEKSRTHQ